MASGFSRSVDAIDLEEVALPYDVMSKELDDTPRLVTGSENLFGTLSQKLIKRPGFPQYLSLSSVTGRVDRLIPYTTEEETPKVYFLASVFNGSTWKAYYIRPESGGGWTSLGTLRELDVSTRPHEMTVHKGKVYIKGYPPNDRLGSVVWDGSNLTLSVWGLLGPNLGVHYIDPSFFTPTAPGTVSVRLGWKYAYAYKTALGHISNRSPISTDSSAPTSTGPFEDAIPQIEYSGTADTTNIPFVVIYRTLDGGGNYSFLEEIANPGVGVYTYEDNSGTGGVPVPDELLDTAQAAPSETSNDPPPPVTDPKTVGGDLVEKSTNIVSQQGRLWFAIRGSLFYSGLEEIFAGLPEHSWPSGILTGNYFSAGGISIALESSPTGVLWFLNRDVHIIRGFNRESFADALILSNCGMPINHPRAHTRYQDVAFWITYDFRVCALVSERLVVLSQSLGADIISRLGPNKELELSVWAEQEKELLVVTLVDKTTPGSVSWAFDLPRQVWNAPWSSKITAMASAQGRESVERAELMVSQWNGTVSGLAHMSFDTKQDYVPGTGAVNFQPTLVTNLMRIPIGNHMNPLRRPVAVPDVMGFILQRRKFTGDASPTLSYTFDEIPTATYTTLTPLSRPPRRPQSVNYREEWYMLERTCQRVGIKIVPDATKDFELQTLAFVFRPESGV